MSNNIHVGSSLDDLLEETGELCEVNAVAIKRVIAWELSEMMRVQHISKAKMALRLETSRSALDRLLDPTNTSITLNTLDHAARTIGKKINIELVPA
ncbi:MULTISPECIES: XRE family transcriptional regulator [Alteromonadales]|jgi:antitoxin HicB|uniref:XRE family transcriptional regulator n=1 Tax=Alteromonadales TaxID=135622 RepID=UPI000C345FF1|nr:MULTISPECIES: XRE family transcriptional regulator [Alteromonadales]PKG96167.1 Fis family transcriptional regulator [Paraglaciecola sp. MB-3u-78]